VVSVGSSFSLVGSSCVAGLLSSGWFLLRSEEGCGRGVVEDSGRGDSWGKGVPVILSLLLSFGGDAADGGSSGSIWGGAMRAGGGSKLQIGSFVEGGAGGLLSTTTDLGDVVDKVEGSWSLGRRSTFANGSNGRRGRGCMVRTGGGGMEGYLNVCWGRVEVELGGVLWRGDGVVVITGSSSVSLGNGADSRPSTVLC